MACRILVIFKFLVICLSFVGDRVSAWGYSTMVPYYTEGYTEETCQAPDAVTGLTAATVGSDKLNVTWRASVSHRDNHCPDTDYNVTYELTNLDQCQQGDHSGGSLNTPDTTITLDGLKAYSTYRVTVTPMNPSGNGRPVSLTKRTGVSNPTGVPVISVSSSSIRSIRFTWSEVPCGSRHDRITRYQYVMESASNTFPTSGSYTSSTSKTFTGLSPCTSYTLKVRAVTSSGSGPWTAQASQNTTAIVPGSVTLLETTSPISTEIHVSWQRPSDCFVDVFTIKYQLDNRDQCDAARLQSRKLLPSVSQSPVTITGLYPHSTYLVYVTPSNRMGQGKERSTVTTTTGTVPSGPPTQLQSSDVTNTTMTFSWELPECGQRHGEITEYRYTLTNAANRKQTTGVINRTTTHVTDLWPFTNYTFTLYAMNNFGSGPSLSCTRRTTVGVPSKPELLILANFSQTTVTLVWSKPQMPNGLIDEYIVEYRVLARPYDTTFKFELNSTFKVQEVVDLSSLRAVIPDLEPSTKYEIHIWAVNSAGIAGQKERLDVYTQMATDLPTPDKPTLIGEESTVSAIAIRLVSKSTSKYISSYQIGVMDISNGSTLEGKTSERSVPEFRHYDENPSAYVAAELPGSLPGKFLVGDNKTYGYYWNPPLQEGAVYKIYVGAVSRINEKMASIVWNNEPLMIEVDGDYSEVNVTAAVLVLVLLLVVIAAVLAVISQIRRQRSKSRPQRRTSVESIDAVELESAQKFPPGSANTQCSASPTDLLYDRYIKQTAPCVSNSHAVSVSTVQPSQTSTGNLATDCPYETYTDSSDDIYLEPSKCLSSNNWPAMSNKGAVKLIPYLHGQSIDAASLRSVASPSSVACPGSVASPGSVEPPDSVAVVNLAQFIEERKAENNTGFKQDFKILSTKPSYPQTIAKMKGNAKKNRYINVLPYNHSRVVLDAIEGDPHSDYINASYIDGYKRKSRYIACQGPSQVTVNDMWRMVWQERVGKIVMLTNLVEKGKDRCEKYWPDQSSRYGEFLVTNVKEDAHPTFILRTFKVCKIVVLEGESFQVQQYHYIKWPDMKPPESSSLLEFIGRVKESETTQHGPTVVHCSTGTGRTGTFIALDILLEQSEAEGRVDVLKCAGNMIDKRYQLVQTEDQYQFIFETLLVSSQPARKVLSKDYQPTHFQPRKSQVKSASKIYDNFRLQPQISSSNKRTRYQDSYPLYENWKK